MLDIYKASAGAGKTFALTLDMVRLTNELNSNDRYISEYKSETGFSDLSEIKILGLIILLLLCMEWFLLKFFAG